MKTLDYIKTLTNEEITAKLYHFLDENCVKLALPKETRTYLATRGIYGPYKNLKGDML